jgi:hypothetical protein
MNFFPMTEQKNDLMDRIVSLCKRRGFIFPSSEIYGGFAAVYDFGPYGVELARNIREAWWKAMVRDHENIVGLDSAIFMHPKVWEASGHVGGSPIRSPNARNVTRAFAWTIFWRMRECRRTRR